MSNELYFSNIHEHTTLKNNDKCWLVLNVNSSNISAISLHTLTTLRNIRNKLNAIMKNYFDIYVYAIKKRRGHRGRNRMIVGFTTIYAISAYHH
jgi:exoribonuclease II